MQVCPVSGGLHVIAELIHLDQETHGTQNDPINMALRRYAGMAMTNLTYGDVLNKVTKTQQVMRLLYFYIMDGSHKITGGQILLQTYQCPQG